MEEQEIVQINQTEHNRNLAPQIPNPLKPDERITFENDFGESPVGLGHFTRDQGAIAILTLAGAFVGAALGGLPFAGVILLAGWNDVRFAGSDEKEGSISLPSRIEEATMPTLPQAIEVPATEVHPGGDPVTNIHKPTLSRLPPFERQRIVDESKGLMIIGDMGAAKTCVAQYIANGFEGYGIIVFDPHGKTDWGNAYVITKMGAIYKQMAILLDLLENGDEAPLLIICDEWLEIRGDRRNKKGSQYAGLADDFIRLFSTKPRKFNKLAGFVLHSPNVEAAGVDSFLRENYLKVYLGRLAKKVFPDILECAYPCVLEDEQQQHPTHGHHTEFKPKGKAPRYLQPLSSAPINIPLAYMDGGKVKVCDRGWSDGQLRLDVTNIRNQLEMLYRDTGNDTSIDTDTSYQEEGISGDTDDTGTDTSSPSIDTENDTDAEETPETVANTSGSSGIDQVPNSSIDTRGDTKRYTPAHLTREQTLILIQHMQPSRSQTQIIQDLWCVEKNKQGWKQAYAEYKELIGEG